MERTLETIPGDLRAYNRLVQGTFQHVDALQAERVTNLELRAQWLYAADGHGYFLRDDGGVDWAITREAENLVLRHLDDRVNSSYEQLTTKKNYRPDNAEALAARAAEGTVVVDMSKLRLSGKEKEWRYLQIRTQDGFILTNDGYQAPNEEEQRAMTRLGYSPETLKMLRDSVQKISETKIFVLNPEYVREEAPKDPEHASLWRASRLNYFYHDSDFNANYWGVNDHFRLRGVHASGSEQQCA